MIYEGVEQPGLKSIQFYVRKKTDSSNYRLLTWDTIFIVVIYQKHIKNTPSLDIPILLPKNPSAFKL